MCSSLIYDIDPHQLAGLLGVDVTTVEKGEIFLSPRGGLDRLNANNVGDSCSDRSVNNRSDILNTSSPPQRVSRLIPRSQKSRDPVLPITHRSNWANHTFRLWNVVLLEQLNSYVTKCSGYTNIIDVERL